MLMVQAERVEDCFDGSSVFSCAFAATWRAEDVLRLRALGELDYFPDFPRPFFRLRTPGGTQLKGVVGSDRCRVWLPRRGRAEETARLLAYFDAPGIHAVFRFETERKV